MRQLPIDFNDLFLFHEVVQAGGFSAAERRLGIPKSRLSRRINILETSLETRLLQRSARQFSLTETGRILFIYCTKMISIAEAGVSDVRSQINSPSGLIRLSVPVAFADVILSKVLPPFMHKYPKIKLEVDATNKSRDLYQDKFDIAIRDKETILPNSSLIQIHLCNVKWIFVASPSVGKSNSIKIPQQLASLSALLLEDVDDAKGNMKIYAGNNVNCSVKAGVCIRSNNINIIKRAAIEGLGVAGLPEYTCYEELRNGQLISILAGYSPRVGELVMLYPSRKGILPGIKLLISHLKIKTKEILDSHQ
ncbi:TPA: LysR family transcriptional regulator [Escherichia coli]|nr:LysR family transcriptional regulator [Escherichia coli]